MRLCCALSWQGVRQIHVHHSCQKGKAQLKRESLQQEDRHSIVLPLGEVQHKGIPGDNMIWVSLCFCWLIECNMGRFIALHWSVTKHMHWLYHNSILMIKSIVMLLLLCGLLVCGGCQQPWALGPSSLFSTSTLLLIKALSTSDQRWAYFSMQTILEDCRHFTGLPRYLTQALQPAMSCWQGLTGAQPLHRML